MKSGKVIGVLLLIFAVFTILGMIIDNNDFWGIYNYVALILSIGSGIVLIKQK
jgi:hypothetical protein